MLVWSAGGIAHRVSKLSLLATGFTWTREHDWNTCNGKSHSLRKRIHIVFRSFQSNCNPCRYEYNGAKVHSFHLSTENVLEGFDLTWPMRKNWPYARAVNTAMVRAVECGIVEYWMTQFKAGKFAWDKEAELVGAAASTHLPMILFYLLNFLHFCHPIIFSAD